MPLNITTPTPEDIERIRRERALECAPVPLSMHTARRLVDFIAEAPCKTKGERQRRDDLLYILRYSIERATKEFEQQHADSAGG